MGPHGPDLLDCARVRAGDVRSWLGCGIEASERMAFVQGVTGMWGLDRTVSLVASHESDVDALIGDAPR